MFFTFASPCTPLPPSPLGGPKRCILRDAFVCHNNNRKKNLQHAAGSCLRLAQRFITQMKRKKKKNQGRTKPKKRNKKQTEEEEEEEGKQKKTNQRKGNSQPALTRHRVMIRWEYRRYYPFALSSFPTPPPLPTQRKCRHPTHAPTYNIGNTHTQVQTQRVLLNRTYKRF